MIKVLLILRSGWLLHGFHSEERLWIAGARLFLQVGCPSCLPTNSVKALKERKHTVLRRVQNRTVHFHDKKNEKCTGYLHMLTTIIMPRPDRVQALSDDVHLTSFWHLSVAYIGPTSRTERPRKTTIVTEVAHVTRDSCTLSRSKGQRSTCRGRGHIVAASCTAC